MLLGGVPIAEALLAGAKSYPGPHGELFLTVDVDPNGVTLAAAGSVAILRSGSAAYVNVDGQARWKKIGDWAPPWTGPLTTYADIDFRLVPSLDIKAGGDTSFVRGGITFTAVNTAVCSTCAISANGLRVGGKGTSGEPYQQVTPPGCSILFSPKDMFNGVGLAGVREIWSWYAFENDESSTSRNWNGKSGGFRTELIIDGIQRSHFSTGYGVSGTSGVTYPKRMFCVTNVGTAALNPLTELVVPGGEVTVFAVVQKFGGLHWEVYVGSTVNGKQWPNRGSLSYLSSYKPTSLSDYWVDSSAPSVVLDWRSSAYYRNRIVSGAWLGGAAPETWINLIRLKIEAELLP